MDISNLLGISTNFIDFMVEKIDMTNLNWIGKVIQWLIEGIGIMGVGIIVFTLILKTIVLPLDVYSRISTKKQSLIMKKMRPQMEKLQKQYANDEQMYNQKVMELQKANGYSIFGACLPMIVSLVIFIYIFNAFSTYSQYSNLSTYNNMVEAYNQSVQTYVISDDNPDGFLILGKDPATDELGYYVDFDAFKKVYTDAGNTLDANYDSLKESEKKIIVRDFVRNIAREAAADYYRNNTTDFLWVKNLWYPDSMFNKEVPDFEKFSTTVTRAVGSVIDASYELSYNEVTYNLSTEKQAYNGYFVLIILAIGLMFLQQFITMRSQKDANELSTVDGTGATTNKMMMVMMPIIYGLFSFLYSAAFSIYMITNTIYSLITMVIINKIMDVRFAKHGDEILNKKKAKQTNNRKRLK